MKKHLAARGILIALGLMALILFLIPLYRSARINIGSVTGIICSLLLTGYGLFMKSVHNLIKRIQKRLPGRILLGFCLVVIAGIMLCVMVETGFMIKGASNKPKGDEVVVVLGCRAYGDRPSLSMTERLDKAYEYLAEHPDAMVILSGGQGKGESVSEAEVMYRYLKRHGIEEERMLKEEESRDTYENLTNVKQMLKDSGMEERIAIVTSEYHAYRSSLIADRLGLENTSIPARTAWWLLPTYYIREMYGILHQWIFGR